MKKFWFLNIVVIFVTALSFVSCDECVTDDKGVVRCVETTEGHNNYGKKYKVDIRIKSGYNTFDYTLYTNKSYRVGDSVYIK
jgi:hypothetical protein